MANELQFYGLIAQSGLTVTAQVYDSAGAQVGSDAACAEVGTSAIYIGDMPTAAAGSYGVRFFADGEVIGAGGIEWDGTQEITGRDIIAETQQSEADVIAALPSVAGLATSAEIAALNDFDPATDTVARVTLVDTTTTNTDMRGTDGAATTAGDASAAQQTAILSAISALNDLSAADVTAAVPTAAQIATAVEAAIINEGDGQQVIDAIVQAIGNENVTAATIAAAVWSNVTRSLTETTDANIVEVTGQPISGAGTKADPWGP